MRLEVRMEKESVWLSQMQMADLFQKDRTVIGKHIKNVFKEGELAKDITCANFAHYFSIYDFKPLEFEGVTVANFATVQSELWNRSRDSKLAFL